MNKTREQLLTMDMGKLFSKLALPAVVGMVILGLYNLVDAIFVGRFVGKDAVAAIVLVYPVVLVNQAISTVLGMGSMSLLSRALGSKDSVTIQRLLGNLSLSIVLLSSALSVVTYLFAAPIVAFLGGKGEILAMGERYLRVLCLGFVCAALGPAMNMLLRGEGRMKEAMVIASSGMVLNIILDPLFIRVLGMGVRGAALATVVSQSVYLVLSILYFQLGKSVIKLRWKNARFAFDLMPDILGVGVSSMSMLVMVAVQQIIVFKTLAFHGNNDHIALMAVAFRILLFAIVPLAGIGQALQPIVGVNYGARNHRRVAAAFRTFTLIASAISGAVWLVFMLIPRVVLGWFFTDPDFVLWGQRYFRIFLSVFFLMGTNINSIILFQALGKGAYAAAVALSKQAVLFIPFVLVLPLFLEAAGVWLAMPLADGLAFGVAIALLVVTFRRLRGRAPESGTGSLGPVRRAA